MNPELAQISRFFGLPARSVRGASGRRRVGNLDGSRGADLAAFLGIHIEYDAARRPSTMH